MNFDIETIKKHKIFIGILAGTVLLAILIGIGLFSSYKKYLNQKNELKQMLESYEQLVKRQPYPNEKNLALLSSNIIEMAYQFNNLNEELRLNAINPKPISNTDFMRLLENKLSSLRSTMERKGIKLPEKYAFGFEKYAGGQLPSQEEVPRLMQQLIMIEKICLILTHCNIKELLSVSREVFEIKEEPTQTKRGRGRESKEEPAMQPVQRGNTLYTNETFRVSFRCAENSLLDVINQMASSPIFIRIKSLEVQNTRKDFNTQSFPTEAGKTNIFVSKAIIIGKEDMEAKLAIDVFSFAQSFSEEEIMKMAGKPIRKTSK